jgi:hypothetical protein
MRRRFCVIAWCRTSLNLGIGRVYYPRNESYGKAEKMSNIIADEY